jgi:hypothetical protein
VARVASGAACKLAFPTMCPAGEYCDGVNPTMGKIDGTCKPLPTQGQDCIQDQGSSGCVEGLVCGGSDKKCKPIGKNGAACTSRSECYGVCTNGVCAAENACSQ